MTDIEKVARAIVEAMYQEALTDEQWAEVMADGAPLMWGAAAFAAMQPAPQEPVGSAAEITRLTEALRAAEEREKGLQGLVPHFDRLALAVAQFGPHSGFHDWWMDAKEARAALKGPSHDA